MKVMMNLSSLFIFFLASFFFSLITVGVVKYITVKMNWVAHPREDRWHSKITSLHGGVGIFLAWFFISIYILFQFDDIPSVFYYFLAGLFLSFVAGLLDDVYHFKPGIKLLWQIFAAIMVISHGVAIALTPWPLFNYLLTLLWIVGITNAINMIDNMDGLAAGIIFISVTFIGFFIFNASSDTKIVSLLFVLVFAGVMLGFLIYNFKPASIFMGDSGSLFIGYFISVLTVSSPLSSDWMSTVVTSAGFNESALLLPVLILSVPIFDLIFVCISRISRGRKFYIGGRDHSSHRLVNLGFNERAAVSILYVVGIISGFTAILGYSYPSYILWITFVWSVALIVFALLIRNGLNLENE